MAKTKSLISLLLLLLCLPLFTWAKFQNTNIVFLKKSSMAAMRALTTNEVKLLKNGYYQGVVFSGYFKDGDTPEPIHYYLSRGNSPDNSGSIIRVKELILEHMFEGSVNAKYFGCFGNDKVDDTEAMRELFKYSSSKNLIAVFEDGTYIINVLKEKMPDWPTSSFRAFDIYSNLHIEGLGKNVVFKVKDNSATLSAPKFYHMFASVQKRNNISFKNITFDGNFTKNRMSPEASKGKYNKYNQDFIGFWGNNANGSNVTISNCIFKNNPGMNNIICQVTRDASAGSIGTGWKIENCSHLDGGLDADDFSAIFALCDNITITGNLFKQSKTPRKANDPGARNAYESHGSNQYFENNTIENYFAGVIINSNFFKTCNNIVVRKNTIKNSYINGIRLWRQSWGPKNAIQTTMKGVKITENNIYVNAVPFANTTSEFKGGIIAGASFQYGYEDVLIANNNIYFDKGIVNPSAGICLTFQPVGQQKGYEFKKLIINNNSVYNALSGVLIRMPNNSVLLESLEITDNKFYNITNTATNKVAVGINISSSPQSLGIGTLKISNNKIKGNAEIGVRLEGKIKVVDMKNNNDLKESKIPFYKR
jgi:hypothetical protein